MFTQRISQLFVPLLVVCLVAVGLVAGAAPAWAADISWRTTGRQISSQGNHYTREGTAIFMPTSGPMVTVWTGIYELAPK